MEYIAYKRFRDKGIGGQFNISFGTICTEREGFLYAPDGRCITAATSENGWEHFRPNTPEGERRQEMLNRLYRYYLSGKGDAAEIQAPEAENQYWKNILRTMPTAQLTEFYERRLQPCTK